MLTYMLYSYIYIYRRFSNRPYHILVGNYVFLRWYTFCVVPWCVVPCAGGCLWRDWLWSISVLIRERLGSKKKRNSGWSLMNIKAFWELHKCQAKKNVHTSAAKCKQKWQLEIGMSKSWDLRSWSLGVGWFARVSVPEFPACKSSEKHWVFSHFWSISI